MLKFKSYVYICNSGTEYVVEIVMTLHDNARDQPFLKSDMNVPCGYRPVEVQKFPGQIQTLIKLHKFLA